MRSAPPILAPSWPITLLSLLMLFLMASNVESSQTSKRSIQDQARAGDTQGGAQEDRSRRNSADNMESNVDHESEGKTGSKEPEESSARTTVKTTSSSEKHGESNFTTTSSTATSPPRTTPSATTPTTTTTEVTTTTTTPSPTTTTTTTATTTTPSITTEHSSPPEAASVFDSTIIAVVAIVVIVVLGIGGAIVFFVCRKSKKEEDEDPNRIDPAQVLENIKELQQDSKNKRKKSVKQSMPSLETKTCVPKHNNFRIPAKDITFQGPLKMQSRFTGEHSNPYENKPDSEVHSIKEIVFDPALNEAVEVGAGVEIYEDNAPSAVSSLHETSKTTEYLKDLDILPSQRQLEKMVNNMTKKKGKDRKKGEKEKKSKRAKKAKGKSTEKSVDRSLAIDKTEQSVDKTCEAADYRLIMLQPPPK